jgi:hypothetical protein
MTGRRKRRKKKKEEEEEGRRRKGRCNRRATETQRLKA